MTTVSNNENEEKLNMYTGKAKLWKTESEEQRKVEKDKNKTKNRRLNRIPGRNLNRKRKREKIGQ